MTWQFSAWRGVGGMSRVLLLSAGLALPVLGASDSGFLSHIEGYYSAPSRNCTEPQAGKLVPCDPPVSDCMLIKKIDDKHAKIHVYSVQDNGSQCEIEGVAGLRGQTLRYIERADGVVSPRGTVDVKFMKGKITFAYLTEPAPGALGLCGAHARLDWVEFLLKDKQPLAHGGCGNSTDF